MNITAISKPRTVNADLTKLPAALLPLTELRRWVIWKWKQKKDGKWTKVPYKTEFYNEHAASDNSTTWGTYAEAVLAFTQGRCDGIGLMLKDGELGAIDLDHIRDFATGQVLRWAEELFAEAAVAGCYIEWTVSGTGARIIGIARGSELDTRIKLNRKTECAVEFYRDCERYITISGAQIYGDYPALPVTEKLPEYDALFDTLYARFRDEQQRPAASDCEFFDGLAVEEIDQKIKNKPAGKFLDFNDAGPQDVVDYDALIRDGVPEGERSEKFQQVVWHLAAQGKSVEEIAEELAKNPNGIGAKYADRLLAEVQRSYQKWQDNKQTAVTGIAVPIAGAGGGAGGGGAGGTSASGTGAGGTGAAPVINPWPTIRIKQGEIPRVVNEAETALLQLNPEIYQYGDMLVQAHLKLIKASGGREFWGWRLSEVTVMNLVEYFSCAACFRRFDRRKNKKKWVRVDPPQKIAQAYLDRPQKRVPQIMGIANAPFLRVDGTICDCEGYDPATNILCKWDGQVFSPVPLNPSRDDALAALAVLEQPFAEFPFVSLVDKSAALSGTLTALDRKSMDIAPLHAFTAPAGGTGKGLLIDIIATIATGRPMPVDNQGHNDEEQEKRLGASLIEGDSLAGIDNCERPLEGAFLNSAITQHVIRVRVLGKSKKVECPNCILLFANGNGLIIGDSMTRRVILSELDAKMERPETREFKDNRLLETMRTNRVKLVIAGLTVLRAWHIARPTANIKLHSLDFVEWTERVPKALVWLGRPDPGDTMKKARENDPYRIKRTTVFAEWYRVLGDELKLVREVIVAAINDPNFHDSLLTVAATRNGKEISPDRLGRWLAKNSGTIVGGFVLVRGGLNSSGLPSWGLEKI